MPEDTTDNFYDKSAAANGRARVRRGEESYPEEPWEKRRRNVDGASNVGRTNSNFKERFRTEDDAVGGDLRGRVSLQDITQKPITNQTYQKPFL